MRGESEKKCIFAIENGEKKCSTLIKNGAEKCIE
jgi:hypothetical protein